MIAARERAPRVLVMMVTLVAVGRHVGLASLAGIMAGVLIGGVLGRVAMRISGFTAGPILAGARTSNDNVVGDITFAGTLALIVFVGVGSGLLGGLAYAIVEPWVRRFRPWHGLAYGLGLLGAAGSLVLDPSNLDFSAFGSAPLNIAMFAALFVLFGVAIALVFDRLRRTAGSAGTIARTVTGLGWLALLLAVVLAGSAAISSGVNAILLLLFVLPLAIAAVVRWRGLPSPIGYGALAVPVLFGGVQTIGGLPRLLTGLLIGF